MSGSPSPSQVDEFVLAAIDSVPHLESLLLMWSTRPRAWSAEETAASLYIDSGRANDILGALVRRGLACSAEREPERFCYAARSAEQDALVGELEREYKRNLIRITRIIHSKAAPGVREFAQAFQFKKDPLA